IYSLVETAKLNGQESYTWLRRRYSAFFKVVVASAV
ncbi:transposase domain-containing protein, partial [Pseudomonas syringae pv. theae]|nr:transposase domain-containing protein [Pseudomonas syringae pv. theae]